MAHFLRQCHYLFAVLLLLVITGCTELPFYPEPKPEPVPARKAINPPLFPDAPYSGMRTPMPGTRAGAPMPGPGGEPRLVKVGLLVPLSGESAELGQSLLDAATLAIFDKYNSMPPDKQTVKLVLIPKDIKNTPGEAAKAAEAALDEGAELLIGPVFSRSVSAVAPIARARGVNVISFSNSQSVAERGVFLFGFMPEQQVERVVNFALGRGVKRFVGVAPQDAFGKAVTEVMNSTLTRRNMPAATMEYYPSHGGGLPEKMNVLAGKVAGMDHSQPTGIFIPEGGDRLQLMMKALVNSPDASKIKNVRMLGTGLWDDPVNLRTSYMQGAWFASSPPDLYKAFETRFYKQYNYRPQRIASLAYDAVALAASLALAPTGPNFGIDAITDDGGFMGPANGIFRFDKRGASQRGLAILEITPKGFQVVDPAPEAFFQ